MAAAQGRARRYQSKHVPQLQNRETKHKQNRTKMVSYNVLPSTYLRCFSATHEAWQSVHQFDCVSNTTRIQLVTVE